MISASDSGCVTQNPSMELHLQDHQEQTKQHLCKLCNKSFSNGKVLGGHMRSHRSTQNPPKKRKKNSITASYSLRENPKKSWKFSAPIPQNPQTPSQENCCKICGKGFDSSKALFGHMRHHSGRRKESIQKSKEKECNNKDLGNLKSLRCQSPIGAGQSDGETLGLLRRKRSRRTRCKLSNPYCCAASPCSSDLIEHSSSCVVDGIEPDVEELALCLLMLSKGVDHYGGEFSSESMGGSHCSGFKAKLPLKRATHLDLDLDLDSEEEEEERAKVGVFPEVGRYLKPLKKCEIEGFYVKVSEEEVNGESGKEGKHQCGVCLKVFGSGKALGGHKRAHLLKPNLMNLEEEDDDEDDEDDDDEDEEDDDEFKPWWNGDGDDHHNGGRQLVEALASSN